MVHNGPEVALAARPHQECGFVASLYQVYAKNSTLILTPVKARQKPHYTCLAKISGGCFGVEKNTNREKPVFLPIHINQQLEKQCDYKIVFYLSISWSLTTLLHCSFLKLCLHLYQKVALQFYLIHSVFHQPI